MRIFFTTQQRWRVLRHRICVLSYKYLCREIASMHRSSHQTTYSSSLWSRKGKSTTYPISESDHHDSTGQSIMITWSILRSGLLWKRLLKYRLLSLCIPTPLLPWISCHHVLTIPPSLQVYLYIYKGYDLSTPHNLNTCRRLPMQMSLV